jgi:hypothetical protein
MSWLTAGWLQCSWRAAAENEPAATTRAKTSKCRVSITAANHNLFFEVPKYLPHRRHTTT